LTCRSALTIVVLLPMLGRSSSHDDSLLTMKLAFHNIWCISLIIAHLIGSVVSAEHTVAKHTVTHSAHHHHVHFKHIYNHVPEHVGCIEHLTSESCEDEDFCGLVQLADSSSLIYAPAVTFVHQVDVSTPASPVSSLVETPRCIGPPCRAPPIL